jgi:hypothetical protein
MAPKGFQKAALIAAFANELDPEGTLDPNERRRLAEAALTRHMRELAARSVATRRRRAAIAKAAERKLDLLIEAGVVLPQ